MPNNIVQVQFKRRYGSGYSDNQYAYIADVPLAVGDIVNVPTRLGVQEARVSQVGVPESDIPAWCGELKHITENASPAGSLFDAFF